jgi:hypothetical protein
VTNEIGHENLVSSSCDATLAMRWLLNEYPVGLVAKPAMYDSGARTGEAAEEVMIELRKGRRGDNVVLWSAVASAIALKKINQNEF